MSRFFCKHDETKEHLSQGDVLSGVVHSIYSSNDNQIEEYQIEYEYAIVATQECDLIFDHQERQSGESDTAKANNKKIHQILLLPAYRASDFFDGKHLQDLNLEMRQIGAKEQLKFENDDFDRYHYFKQSVELDTPDLIVDFKHYFTVPRDHLYENSYKKVCSLGVPFREAFIQRFTNFLARIPLP